MQQFASPEEFAVFLQARIAAVEVGFEATLATVGQIVKRNAQARIGNYQPAVGPFPKWEELAEWTQEDRDAKGYSTDEPLLREGLLRASIGAEVTTPFSVTVGVRSGIPTHDGRATTGEVAMWQEFGASRLGQPWIPPRPFIGPAAFETAPEAVEMLSTSVMARLTGFPNATFASRFFTSAPIYGALAEAFAQGRSETGG